ncbi:hypothetical protein SAMN05216553_103240 [Lentzea fradiae]|uniref:DUF1062 domain-containing protein n=1 Tax=Lentzea fradiae TaxID=200378 RepID=A0A1G7NX13_9PSEU|nr:hypothetical protein SAMN05216553_103240 [Lentzea fradiae]
MCGSERFRANGKFRVNANHKVLDAWLLVLCTGCEDTVKLTVLDRVTVRSVRPELLDRLHHNDIRLAGELLQDTVLQRRNRVRLDWDGAWRLDTGGSGHLDREIADVEVRFRAKIPVRPVRLVAEGFGLSAAAAGRLLDEGSLVSAVRLTGRVARDFAFTLKRDGTMSG